MRQFIIGMMVLGLSIQLGYSQKRTDYKKEKNLVSVVSYHDNGQIAQKGYLKNNKLHGEWISYTETGEKLAQGTFLKGKKIGKWFFWQSERMTEVSFENNLPIDNVVWERGAVASID